MFAFVKWPLFFWGTIARAFVVTKAFTPMRCTTRHTCLSEMKRPILDQLVSTLFRLENARVQASSKIDEQGRVGDPMEWREKDSWANQLSEWLAGAPFNQWIAD
ncbi:hypothetical protein FisN_2Lu571 [Fistulifera solaris]|uniref:Uncharacterized protein n=1 Tax=Fistulifera solaris TaxID=1519565 RepID=A0A1Z5JAX1_FISSO|nr:hypothetical protein FisN_2Lu571 [Fistulifera solaris]|eukprot:GAX11042.1 hypothetical protein FisN_2Lu571 [Fistulifera solaris]